ncbi:hypothetical protein [Mycolicibacter algericus]|uniref:hypothetical protein n=1 Tax=Mycolicibacter algericus TaxID=1288388 RepID=UPI003C71F636
MMDEIKRLLTPPAGRSVNEMKLQISEIGPGPGVGRWVLVHKGEVGRSLKTIDVIASHRDLGLLCPSPVVSWDDTPSTAG